MTTKSCSRGCVVRTTEPVQCVRHRRWMFTDDDDEHEDPPCRCGDRDCPECVGTKRRYRPEHDPDRADAIGSW